MKKFLAFLVSLILLLSCSAALAEQQSEKWIADRTIVGRAFVTDIGVALPDDQLNNEVSKALKERTGIEFYWEFTSGNDDLEVLTTMLAVGDIPDIIISYLDHSGRPEFPVLKQAIQAGMFLNMEPYLEQTEVLKQYLDDSWLPGDTAQNVNRNAEYPDDGIYMLHLRIPRYAGATGYDDLALYMNMEVSEAVGIKPEEITTTESLIAAAEKIKAAGLKDKNGQDIIPIGTSVWGGRMQSEYYMSAAISPGRESLYGIVDGKVAHISGTDLLEKQVMYIREMLEKELIDPEVYTMSSARAQENFINGHWAFVIANPGQTNTKYFDTGIEWLPCFHLTDRHGVDAVELPFKSGSQVIAINAEAENPEEIIAFIDYMASREGKLLWNYGVEGYHYDLDEEGFPIVRQEWLDLRDKDATAAMQEGVYALGAAWGVLGRTDIAHFDDFGEYTHNDRRSPEKVEHKQYINTYSDPNFVYYDGVSAASFFSNLPESTQMKLEQFVEPSYHKDIFVKACFADSEEEVQKILGDYRELLVKQGIEEFEALLQEVYETAPESIHFN